MTGILAAALLYRLTFAQPPKPQPKPTLAQVFTEAGFDPADCHATQRDWYGRPAEAECHGQGRSFAHFTLNPAALDSAGIDEP